MFEKQEKPKTVPVSRSLVNEFVNMETLPRDRPLSERRLMVYGRILAKGEFRPVVWASAYCEEDGITYRVNGKHTSTLLSGLDVLPADFYVTIERYRCPTMEDVAKLYATFDSKESVRNLGDIIHSFASTVPALADVNRKTLGFVVSAASYHEWGMGYFSLPATERAELILDNVDFALWLDNMLYPRDGDSGRARRLLRAPVVASMMGTWRRYKAASSTFWGHVRDEDEPQGENSRLLARFLVETALRNTHVGGKGDKETATFRKMLSLCNQAFNDWKKGKKTSLRYYAAAKIPAIV